MKVALLQHDTVWNDKEKNFVLLEKKLIQAKKEGASVAVMPELSFTGYCMELTGETKETIDGKSAMFMAAMSKKYEMAIVGGITEDDGGGLPKNTCLVYDKGKLVLKYRKIHPFTYTKEDHYFSSGNAIAACRLGNFTCGCVICYDLRFPELFRALVDKGVELIFVIANWPSPREEHWLTLTKARAIESQCYIAAVNRVGKEPGRAYFGCSRILDPWGNEVANAGSSKDTVAVGDVLKEKVNDIRKSFPFLKDRRKGIYPAL